MMSADIIRSEKRFSKYQDATVELNKNANFYFEIIQHCDYVRSNKSNFRIFLSKTYHYK